MPPSRRSSTRVKTPKTPVAPAAKKSTQSANQTPASNPSTGRSLRPRRSSAGIYEISSDSSSEEKSSGSEHQENGGESDEDDDEDPTSSQEVQQNDGADEEPEEERPERGSEAGRSLRPRKSLNVPEGLRDYVDTNSVLAHRRSTKKKPAPPMRRVSGRLPPGRACAACREARRRCDRGKPRCSGCVKSNKPCIVPDGETGQADAMNEWEDYKDEKEITMRTEIRQTMDETRRKRDRFLAHYGDLFQSLLPERNYITKLAEKKAGITHSEEKPAVKVKSNTEEKPVTGSDAEMTDAPSEQIKGEMEIVKKDDAKAQTNGTENGPSETQSNKSEIQENGVKHEEPMKPKEEEQQSIVPYKLLEKQPEGVKATMKPYQLSGLSFLLWLYNNGTSGILGDEMGLGKTLQTLSLFSYLTTNHPSPSGHHRPFLVVCPLSVLSSWIAECKRWTPHLRVLRFHGPGAERQRLKRVAESGDAFGTEAKDGEGTRYDVIVTSYEVFDREKTWFRRAFVWRYVVLDEGHKIKNEKTNVAQALQGLSAEYRLILTGTPLQNNLTELWALLHWLFWEVFTENTSKLFSDAFDLTFGKNDLTVMDNARKLLELVMLRRMKESKGVNLGLPLKTEMVMFLPLAPMQRFWYKRLLTRLDKGLLDGVFKSAKEKVTEDEKEDLHDGKGEHVHVGEHVVKDTELEELGEDQWGETRQIVERAVEESKTDQKWRKLMNLLMQLRKCCDHPYLLPNAEPSEDEERDGSHVILASSKLIFLDKLIEEVCINQGKKVLVFSGFTRMLDVCEDLLHLKGGDGERFKYGRLDGTTPRARRNLGIRLFNSDPDYKVMLISTRAGGLGINLASASDVVMLESDWNPQADLQAQARAHRIGQVNPVTIYRLVTQGTVEEQMMGRIRKKLYLSAKVTEAMRDIHTSTSSAGLNGDADENMPTLSTGQLMSLVRSGSRAIARPEIDPAEMLKWDWETTIKKCRDYQEKLESLDKAVAEDQDEEEKRWLSEMERVETRVFEGKHHVSSTGTESNRDIAQDWSREARRVGMERVVMIDGHAVLKETVGNNEWEAVKTFAGTDPRLAEPPKRKRKAIEHQDFCQVCFDGGMLHTCSGCPRTYHTQCLPPEFVPKLKAKGGQFYCPQHQCVDCEQKTTNAGGMLFRCRWCENAFCEDCMDWDQVELLGETLPELDMLGFGAIEQAFWVKCSGCVATHKEDAQARAFCDQMLKDWAEEKERRETLSAEGMLTMEGTTVDGSEVETPVGEAEVNTGISVVETGRKRKRRSTAVVGPMIGTKAAARSAKKARKTPQKRQRQAPVMQALQPTAQSFVVQPPVQIVQQHFAPPPPRPQQAQQQQPPQPIQPQMGVFQID